MATVADKLITHRLRQPPLRFITATSLFDGHDAAIHIIRRLIQGEGHEVIHLGHNRSVAEIVRAALQEDVDGIAVSSYQGGHMEFFKYLRDTLKVHGAGDIQIFVGGGGTIISQEAVELEAYGIAKVYLPEDGRRLGLEGMIRDLLGRTGKGVKRRRAAEKLGREDHRAIGRMLSMIEQGVDAVSIPRPSEISTDCPVVGITGPGGSGKSSVIDELLNRFLYEFPQRMIALLAIDPTRHKSGGALLGDRIRMNAVDDPRVFMRSMATRRRHLATNAVLADCIQFLKSLGFDLIIVETAGTGQGDSEIVDLVDLSVYVMTTDYGGPGQLEKIEMLDLADLVVLNKYDRGGAADALRDIRKQWRRNHKALGVPDAEVPVYATVASEFSDPGVHRLFLSLCARLERSQVTRSGRWSVMEQVRHGAPATQPIISPRRVHYLAELSEQGRHRRADIERQSQAASRAHSFYTSLKALGDQQLPKPLERYSTDTLGCPAEAGCEPLRRCYEKALSELSEEALELLRAWPEVKARFRAESYRYTVRGRDFSGANYTESLAHLSIPKVALPRYEDWGATLRFLMQENLPGCYPYTAGVFPYRRTSEEPTRMFAGEGGPERTNRRFHYLARGQRATRLSTAFDPIVLYGQDPDQGPDVYGRLGMSGVSVATLDDMKKLYSGFELCRPDTSVSMTINGPACVLLAWFLNAAIDQQVEKYLRATGRWHVAEDKITALFKEKARPRYCGQLPTGHDGLGLGLLGVSGQQVVDREIYERIRSDALATVRGTVQADILKEDQAQNECIFAVEFGLRMMGDIQEYFIAHKVQNYYSVSVSGYHIAEAGANPITQLAFTLANGFTLVEYFLSRGMAIDDFAPNMSFFFSNGMDPEYAVIGRVARRIWARALRDVYHAGPRGQKLKYHIQTSGRSLQAQETGFNDIRTTLQALYALYDNCNSLHTNAYDEAVTTPTEESVRRALAIQLIINRELGLNYNQNPLQGSFLIEELTNMVEEAVYCEFDRLAERGGVLGAMETLYQRGKIQEESLCYERRKHDGSLPIVGVNTFLRKNHVDELGGAGYLVRATDDEKNAQIEALNLFKCNHVQEAPLALQRLKQVVRSGANTFAELMDTVRYCSLGQITGALSEVGGQYRRRL